MSGNRGFMLCSAVPGTVVNLLGRRYRHQNYTVSDKRVGQMVVCIGPSGELINVGANALYKTVAKVSTLS